MVSEHPSMGDLSGLPAALLARRPEPEAPVPMREEVLPPGVERDPIKGLVRRIRRVSEDGSTWTQFRPVALTLEEAKKDRKDYYDSRFGWILNGYKLERDRTPQDIMADGTLASPNPAE